MTDVSVSGNSPPSVTVSGSTVSVSVSSGVGPQGPAGKDGAGGVASLNGLTGTLSIQAGANITVSTSASAITIAGPSGGASTWNDITGKPDLVYSVAGRTGTVTLTTSDIGGYTAPAVSSVAGRTGAVTLTSSDIGDFAAVAALYGPVTSVAGRTGAVTLTTADVSGYQSPPVTSVAGRTGAVTLSTSDISGYTAPAVTSVAGRTGSVTLTGADINVATTTALGVVQVGVGLTATSGVLAGPNITSGTAAPTGGSSGDIYLRYS